tara:strand:- start:4196 stop:5305 length:1110 start_codon:yes stop_codon:yes gene_type:complete
MSSAIKKTNPNQAQAQRRLQEAARLDEEKNGNSLRITRESHDRVREKKEAEEQAKKAGAKKDDNLYERLARHGISALTTNAVMGAVAEGVTAADIPDQQEILEHVPSVEGEMLTGPAEGGGFLERPVAGALADSSVTQSLEMQYLDGADVSAVDGSGVLGVNGQEIPVSEYLPGADIVKIATGESLDAGDGLGLLMERGIDRNRGQTPQRQNGEGSSGDTAANGGDGGDEGRTSDRHIGEDGAPIALGGRQLTKDDNLAPETRKEIKENEIKIEREALEVEHKEELKEALRTQDLGEAVTERTGKHGSLKMETHFEARHPDNAHERHEGENHVTEAVRSPRNETTMDINDIHFRTMMQERENDKGISRF